MRIVRMIKCNPSIFNGRKSSVNPFSIHLLPSTVTFFPVFRYFLAAQSCHLPLKALTSLLLKD